MTQENGSPFEAQVENLFVYEEPTYSWPDDAISEDYPYYCTLSTFPFLEPLKAYKDVILSELKKADASTNSNFLWHAWPEEHLQTQGIDEQKWTVIPFCYTIPADTGSTVWLSGITPFFPQTIALLKCIPGLKTALISKLGPNTTLVPHSGWPDVSNHVLRVHFCLQLLEPGSTGLVVADTVQYHQEGEFITFDDSLVHHAFNTSNYHDRIVLILDIARPRAAPQGMAEGRNAAESLASFIKNFH